jgi:hypothetical protein
MNLQINTYFENIQSVIANDIESAKKEILIAVAWFTNKELFDLLVKKANDNVSVKLIVINDDINNRKFGVDFQEIIGAKGVFYFAEKSIPMHNKYVIIDQKIVITGSYNYTYLAETSNDENVIRVCGFEEIVMDYIKDFERISNRLVPIQSVKDYLIKNPPYSNFFAFNNYGIKDIYQQSIITKEKGFEEDSITIMNFVDKLYVKKKMDSYMIQDVVYRQWKDDYYLEKVVVKDRKIMIRYRTFVSNGCWICSPNTKWTWILRSSSDHKRLIYCEKIENISIDGTIVCERAKDGHIYYIGKDYKDDFSDNNCGYKVNEEKKMIDDNGNMVPVEYIIIGEGKVEMLCDVFFNLDLIDITDGNVDFVEGIDCEKMDNHWHCFDINLNINRISLK